MALPEDRIQRDQRRADDQRQRPGAPVPGFILIVRDFGDAKDQSTAAYAAFFHAMLDRGVYLPPSAFEAWFVSAAHDDSCLGDTLGAFEVAIDRALDALPGARRGREFGLMRGKPAA